MSVIRPAAVAGSFYPATAQELGTTLQKLLHKAASNLDTDTLSNVPKAIVVPHAGYVYSGPMAARAYARLRPAKDIIKRVILLGPCHRVAVKGLALSSAKAFATPLGNIELDQDAIDQIKNLPQVSVFDQTHREEHSLEVHLPFLQIMLGKFKLIPLVVGDCDPQDIVQVIDTLWGGAETLIVISTDLSHFLDYDQAVEIDTRTCKAIEAMDINSIEGNQACGRVPLKGFLKSAKKRGMSVETLGLNNSGDTAGTKDRVVGYGSWAFHEGDCLMVEEPKQDFEQQTRDLLKDHGELLLKISAASIVNGLNKAKAVGIDMNSFPTPLQASGACFITIKKQGDLRGCIGSPQAHRPLIKDVAENAFRAGFHDPRFPKLTSAEIPELSLSVSVLSPATDMSFEDELDFKNQIRPGIDGLIIADGPHRALFLPSVWEQLPDVEIFLSRLKLKSGMKQDHWSETFTAQRFITGEVKQSGLDDPQSIWPE